MSFVITVDLRETEARNKVKGLGAELDGAAAKGTRAGAAIGAGMREGASSAARTQREVSNLAKAFAGISSAVLGEQLGGVAKAFAGVTEQLKREAEMLDRIHGPMTQLQNDIRALDALQRKGMITAEQYSAALGKSQRANGMPVGGSMQERMADPGVQTGMMPAGASGIGAAVTAGAALAVAHEVQQLGDEYLNLKNKLRAVATDEDNLNSLMRQTKTIANDTRSDWEGVAGVYTRLQIALRDVGASQGQVLQMTKTLSQGLQMGGATAFEAQMTMMELSHALQTGTLTGREFRVMMKDAGPMMAELQKVSGKTAAEFAEMGKHGKLSAELLMEYFSKAGPVIEQKFAKTVPTLSQQWTVFKNNLVDSVGSFVEASHIIPIVGNILSDLGSVISTVMSGLGTLASGLAAIGSAAQSVASAFGVDLKIGLGTFLGFIAGGPMGAAIGTFVEGVLSMGGGMLDFVQTLDTNIKLFAAFQIGVEQGVHKVSDFRISIDGLDESMKNLSHTIPDVTQKFLELLIGFDSWDPSKTKKQIDNYGQVLKDVVEPTRTYGEMVKANNEYLANTHDIQGYTIELNKLNKAMLSAYELKGKAAPKGKRIDAGDVIGDLVAREMRDLMTGMKQNDKAFAEFEKRMHAGFIVPLANGFNMLGATAEMFFKNLEKGTAAEKLRQIELATRLWNDALEKNKQRTDEIVQHLQPIEDELVKLTTTGKFSFSAMIDSMIADLARLAIHRAFVALIGSKVGSDGPSTDDAWSHALQAGVAAGAAAGHATGTSFRVGGGAGIDERLVSFRASSNEVVTVQTDEQKKNSDRDGGGGRGYAGPRAVNLIDDRKAMLRHLATAEGEAMVMNIVRRHLSSIRSPNNGGN